MISMWKAVKRLSWAIMIVVWIIFGGGIRPAQAIVTNEDFCRATAGRTIVFIDVTTRFAAGDDRILYAGVESIIRHARPGTRLTFLTITDSFSHMDMPFDQCIPGCAADDGNCSALQAKRMVPEFNEHLRRALGELVPKRSLAASDIALTMSYALRTRPPGEPATVFLFSDMLERSRVLDLQALAHRAAQKPERAEHLRREGVAALKKVGYDLDLAGLKIVVFGFGREDGERRPLDPETVEFVRRFWTEAFRAANATGVEFHARLP
jgi:hypothetical protein